MKTLILGGVRSGKSRLAQRLAVETGLAVTFVATATAGDEEMQRRIANHRAQRPPAWSLIEEPLALADALGAGADQARCIIVDCLTLWLSNLLAEGDVARLERELSALLDLIPELPGHLILVGNETNMGVIPLGELSRRYCDTAGVLHQELAARCNQVILTVAGLPLVVKGDPL